ncbi:Nitric oxide reductase large subunit [Pseudomonas syringae pv. actinidiae]|uniref:Nitric oxide reductase large subunit n=1 Tax=Pseudomonas syringae pv. actinidiae TaxID=103796 RepID=A0AAN4Q3F6_PSESF|nr:Nitric oxide reductase large subunit [Pseudomonas syringae pv. actinidiae]
MFIYDSRHLFAPRRLTLKDQSKQNPGSVSGPTSSDSFALTLIRRSPQRAIHGTVRLARRTASHPPDQRQGSAVTYVALCVVSATAIKSTFFQLSCDAPRRMPFWTLCVLFSGAPRHTAVLQGQ